MRDRHVRLVLLLPLATAAAPLAGEPTAVLACRGHEPEWNLRIDGAAATLATMGTTGLLQTGFEGRLQETAGKPPSFVYRGRTGPSGRDLVAVITRETCGHTMADAAAGGGPSDYTARVSLPDGTTRLGCYSIAPTLAPRPEGEPPKPPAAAAGSPATSTPAPAPAPPPAALPAGRGEVSAVTLSDRRECRSTGKGTTAVSRGQRLSFDCGPLGGDKLGLVGPLTPGPEGLLAAQKLVIEWRDGESAPRQREQGFMLVSSEPILVTAPR